MFTKRTQFEQGAADAQLNRFCDSDAFNAYRGTDFLPETCQSCERLKIDFGGCRCQALAIAGDASATVPTTITQRRMR